MIEFKVLDGLIEGECASVNLEIVAISWQGFA